MAVKLVKAVIPFLLHRGLAFKLPSALDGVFRINSGRAGPLQIGKILTVYPPAEDDTGRLAQELDILWRCSQAPTIVTDVRLHVQSTVYLRYGAIYQAPVLCDIQGRRAFGLHRPDGLIVRDERRADGVQAFWAKPPLSKLAPNRRSPTVRLGRKRFFLVGSLQKSPKSETFIALDETLSTKIVKLVSRGVAEDRFGFDAWDRLAREHTFLLQLQGHNIACPAPIGLSRTNPRALVLQDIAGRSLAKLPAPAIRAALPALIAAVKHVHAAGIVHRDLKLSHAILRGKKLYLVDFEFSAVRGAATFPAGGTNGYIAPESNIGPVTPAQDIYSLGACIAHAFLEVDPAGLLPGPERLAGLLHVIGYGRIASIVLKAMAENPDDRPTLADLEETIRMAASSAGSFVSCDRPRRSFVSKSRRRRNRLTRKIAETAFGCRSYRSISPEYGPWCDPRFPRALQPTNVASGTAGTIIGLASIDAAMARNDFTGDLERAARWLQSQPLSDQACGFFSGEAGIALALAIAGRRVCCSDLLEAARMRLTSAVTHVREPGLFSGAAGVLWSSILISAVLGAVWPIEIAAPVADKLRQSVRSWNGMIYWPFAKDKNRTIQQALGASEGALGIAMTLGLWGRMHEDPSCEQLAVDVLLQTYALWSAPPLDQLNRAASLGPTSPGRSWADGPTGYLWVLLQAFGDDSRLSGALDWVVGEVSNLKLLQSPCYSSGMAMQLEVWQMLCGIDRHREIGLRRAALAARLLEGLGGRSKTGWLWPSNPPDVFTPTLWDGFLGPACAMALHCSGIHTALLSPEWLRIASEPSE